MTRFALHRSNLFGSFPFTKPSRANEEAFNRAVDDVAHVAHHLLESLVTNAPSRNRETETLKAKTLSANRYGTAKAVAA